MRTRWMVGGPREIPRADNAPTSKTKGKEEGLGGHGLADQPLCPTNFGVEQCVLTILHASLVFFTHLVHSKKQFSEFTVLPSHLCMIYRKVKESWEERGLGSDWLSDEQID